ncbi:MAG: nucleoside hydrolase, partial [Chloroflexota bacterium]|nr:nucleoside hydrolase [Chloroflexota bacterium]
MLRSPWFWIAITLITAGIALTAALGALYWLIVAFAAAILMLVVVFLVAAYSVKRADPPQVGHLKKVPESERISVIYDCDLTMGRPFRDVGDGLVLLYILGDPRLYLRFVTTTYSNGSVRLTTRAANRLLNNLEFDDVAVIDGAAGPDDDPETNRAARYLKNIVGESPGEIVLIATG